MKLRSARRPVIVGTAAVAVLALGFGGNAAADAFITGKDVKNNSLSGADIKNNSIGWADIANGAVRGTEIANGSIQLRDLSDAAREELNEGLKEFAAQVNGFFVEAFGGIEALQAADTAQQADIEALEAYDDEIDTALEHLRARIKDAEGTVEDLVSDVAALETAASSLKEDLEALGVKVDGLTEAVEKIQGALASLDTRLTEVESTALVTSNWGDILRNVMGSATTELRNGPYAANFGLDTAPPMGTGSLQIDVANGQSKTAFGNEVDFVGKPVTDLGSPSFWVYTTGENDGMGANNLPNIAIEIDPDVDDTNGRPVNYTTMVFVPTKAANLGGWTKYTATDGKWYFTSTAGTVTGCNQNALCTLDAAMDALGDAATIHSVGVGKGRDHEFHGAVDALTIGDTTYDFEARGVVPVSAAAAKAAKK